jgi:hypothetical protein
MKLAAYEGWRITLEEDGRAATATTKGIRQLERELARKKKAVAKAPRCSFESCCDQLNLARPERFELPTPASGGQCSIH